jgi:serine/threonine-protein kinase
VVDKRTDVYAAGVLLYELLTGERLFALPEGYDYKEVARAVTQGKHPLPSHRDPRLYDFDPIVVKALATDSSKRYQSAEELRDDLAVALARVNPTITGDRLGAWVRQLFAEEMLEERNLIAQAQAIDLSSFADELTDSRTHTVSFALAAAGVEPPAARPDPRMAQAVRPVDSGTMLVDKTGSLGPPPRRRKWLAIGGAAALLIGGGALAAQLVHEDKRPVREEPVVAAVPAPAPPAAAPARPPASQVIVQPITTPLEPEPVATAPAAKEPAPAAPPARKKSARPERDKPRAPARVTAPAAKDPAPAPSGPSAQEVEAKFIAVKKEYGAFRKAYGARLDEEWNDILDLATYGRGDDRYRKLSSRLDRFRARMGEVKTQ